MENTEVKEIEKDVKSQEQIDAELSEEIFIESMKAEEDAHNALITERDDFKNKYLYTLAELDNTKKRFATDRTRIMTQAVSGVVNGAVNTAGQHIPVTVFVYVDFHLAHINLFL